MGFFLANFRKSESNLLCWSTWQKLRYCQRLINPSDYGSDLSLYLEGTKLLVASSIVRSSPHWAISNLQLTERELWFLGLHVILTRVWYFTALCWTKDTVTIFCEAPPCFSVAPLRMVKGVFHCMKLPFNRTTVGLSLLKVIIVVGKQFISQRGMKSKSRFRKCTCLWALLLLTGFMSVLLSCPHQLLSERLVEMAVEESCVEIGTEGLVWQVHLYGSRL